jgi:predicted amidohydrolase
MWPTVHEKHQLSSRQYAFEGRCFVIAAGQMMKAKDFPGELHSPSHLNDDDWVLNGGSCVIDPKADFVVEPVFDEEKLIYAELDLSQVSKESMTLDVTGHYQRKDVFDFKVDHTRR